MTFADALDMLQHALLGLGAGVDLGDVVLDGDTKVVQLPEHRVEVSLHRLPGARRAARLACLVSNRTSRFDDNWRPLKTWWVDVLL